MKKIISIVVCALCALGAGLAAVVHFDGVGIEERLQIIVGL